MYQASDPETIQSLFKSIATKYDRANAIFSFGLHRTWNRRLIESMRGKRQLLDLCAGTGEIGVGFLRENPHAEAWLLDFCPEMLEVARWKGGPFQERMTLMVADAQKIPLERERVEGVTIAYGIRNIQRPRSCFQEVYRVLKRGGKLGILELTRPHSAFLRLSHGIYLKGVLPLLGKLMTNNGDAYKYLASSIQAFVSPEEVGRELLGTGFSQVEICPLFGGIATLILADKS